MKQSDAPKPSEMLKHGIQNDVRAYATFWLLSRLCRQMYLKGALTDDEIEKIFDPMQAQEQMPESHKIEMRKLVDALKSYCLGHNIPMVGLQ
jgi:hypothetical protein